jgi:hypothetical protein
MVLPKYIQLIFDQLSTGDNNIIDSKTKHQFPKDEYDRFISLLKQQKAIGSIQLLENGSFIKF